MKTYEVTQVSEAAVTVKVRASNADEANEKALNRIHEILRALTRSRKCVSFGDITDDYLPARDEP